MNNYYIYKHVEGDEIVYIGLGQNERAWSNHNRGREHKEWLKSTDPFETVQAIERGLTAEQAVIKERELILKHQPKYNVALKTGSKSNHANLDYYEVLAIKTLLYPSGLTQKKIAEMFNTSQGYISNIITGRIWSHV